MFNLCEFQYSTVSWHVAAAEIMELRKKVFVIEQHFDKETLCDQFENDSHHILVSDEQARSVGCGRLSNDGKISKIAVLITYRGLGIGTNILTQLVDLAEHLKIKNLTLSAEQELIQFYDQQKFRTEGPVYMKQGIPYQKMAKKLV